VTASDVVRRRIGPAKISGNSVSERMGKSDIQI
jgi:hypothetical protein